MREKSMIKALAELDGWTNIELDRAHSDMQRSQYTGDHDSGSVFVPDYLTSRDTIIPLIEKQNLTEQQWELFLRNAVPNESDWIANNKLGLGTFTITQSRLPKAFRLLILATPHQLATALLKATERYEN